MNIQSVQNGSIQALQPLRKAAEKPAEAISPEKQSVPAYDRYEPEAAEERQSAGLYEIGHDADGGPKIRFDAPESSKAERTTTNTDQVDREIRALREKLDQLKQQADSAADPSRREMLEKQLSQVEQELRQKDNDAYRRQHAVIS